MFGTTRRLVFCKRSTVKFLVTLEVKISAAQDSRLCSAQNEQQIWARWILNQNCLSLTGKCVLRSKSWQFSIVLMLRCDFNGFRHLFHRSQCSSLCFVAHSKKLVVGARYLFLSMISRALRRTNGGFVASRPSIFATVEAPCVPVSERDFVRLAWYLRSSVQSFNLSTNMQYHFLWKYLRNMGIHIFAWGWETRMSSRLKTSPIQLQPSINLLPR